MSEPPPSRIDLPRASCCRWDDRIQSGAAGGCRVFPYSGDRPDDERGFAPRFQSLNADPRAIHFAQLLAVQPKRSPAPRGSAPTCQVRHPIALFGGRKDADATRWRREGWGHGTSRVKPDARSATRAGIIGVYATWHRPTLATEGIAIYFRFIDGCCDGISVMGVFRADLTAAAAHLRRTAA